MSDSILVTGDDIVFEPDFFQDLKSKKSGKATVMAKGGATLTGTAGITRNGKEICLKGDETAVKALDCDYIAGDYSQGGKGTISIVSLADDQVSKDIVINGRPILVKTDNEESKFIAKFVVQKPARMPPPENTPDPVKTYYGKGYFVSEHKLKISDCPYRAGDYDSGGVGTLTLDTLADNQSLLEDGSVLLKGGEFKGRFVVGTPAKTPPPGNTPDPTKTYEGKGYFVMVHEDVSK